MSIEEHVPLISYTTFGVDVTARYFVRITSVEEMKELMTHPLWREQERCILGGGSNILFTKDFKGLVVLIDIQGRDIIEEKDGSMRIRVGAGEGWHQLVMDTVSMGYWGIENLALIPGTVGAAPVQNIGAYGVEVQESILSVECLNLDTGEIEIFSQQECQFAYRTSIFKKFPQKYLVTHVAFELSKEDQPKLGYESFHEMLSTQDIAELKPQDVAQMVMDIRRLKLPEVGEIGMAGSFFKNPVISQDHFQELQQKFPDIKYFHQTNGEIKIPAGWLIEKFGYKGVQKGNVGTYTKHALVLVNYGGASGEEVWNFAQEIMNTVKERCNITLEPEVIII